LDQPPPLRRRSDCSKKTFRIHPEEDHIQAARKVLTALVKVYKNRLNVSAPPTGGVFCERIF